jgi:hypothetical protein
MDKPYHYTRYSWHKILDLEDIKKEFEKETFEIIMKKPPENEMEIALLKDYRYKLTASADTLTAILSERRAVLYQKESAPFTKKDQKLREKILEFYPHNRPTLLPWSFVSEPDYEVEE